MLPQLATLPRAPATTVEHAPGAPPAPAARVAGDGATLGALLGEQARAVFDLCYHVAGAQDARDATQESLERIVASFARFEPARGTFRAWALAIARNVCRDRLRRRGLERALFDDDGDGCVAEAADTEADPESLALARLDARRLAVALETLPTGMRTALVLFHAHDASYEDIAAALGVPLGTVMTWLHRGRKRLRDAVAAEPRREAT